MAHDRSQIFPWLSPLEPRLRHKDIQERRVKDIGGWILQTEKFRRWCAGTEWGESGDPVLFCYGDPGVGKTYISSLVMDRLCDGARGQNVAVACFYFDFAAQKEQSPTRILGALLKQLVGRVGEVPLEIVRVYANQDSRIGRWVPRLTDIVKMLQDTVSEKRTFICIDALDECAEEHRVRLLDILTQVLQKAPGTRIFMTGRPHIRPEIARCLEGRVASISIIPNRDEIIGCLCAMLGEVTNPDAMGSILEADILKIQKDISKVFLSVSLNIGGILKETSWHRRRQILSEVTEKWELGDVYDAVIGQIKGQGGEKARLGMAALMWISHAERLLKANELCHALAVEIGSPDLDTKNVLSIGTLQICCQGLVAIDKDAFTVRFIHPTLYEYLRAHPKFFGTPHSTMAETCLSYLNSRQVKALSVRRSPNLQHTPFLEYSSLYWGSHAKKDLSERTKLLALTLFDNYNNHISTKILLRAQKEYSEHVNLGRLSRFNGLHCASIFGIVEIVDALVEAERYDINRKDCVGNTPLAWAAWNGHAGVVKFLLGRDNVNPNELDIHGRTPLSCAVENGQEEMVEILLRRQDVLLDILHQDGLALLRYAAENGHEGIVKMLLGRGDFDPNKPDEDCRTVLCCAAGNGHVGVVKVLLERDDVNPGKRGKLGQTPLGCAAWNGHEEVVKMLLERGDVKLERPGVLGHRPICCAARNGFEGVVKILLERGGVDPNKPDGCSRTLLWSAVDYGYEGMVEMLLRRSDVNPNKPYRYGQTPLWRAAWCGNEVVVKMLLERHDVDPNEPDIYFQTPLYCAAEKGLYGVVKILLGRKDVHPNSPDRNGETPLHRVARGGNEEIAKLLLGRKDTNPDIPDHFGQTPLYRAVGKGHHGVVKLLLERGDINPNKPDEDGQTPLHIAADNGDERVVKMLLGRADLNPDISDNCGETPQHRADQNGHGGVVKLLLEREAFNPVKLEGYSRTPARCAAEMGYERVVGIPLARGDVNLPEPGSEGQSSHSGVPENQNL